MKHISLIIPKRILGLILVAGLIVCSCKDDYSEDVITGVQLIDVTDIALDVKETVKLAPGMEQTVSCTILSDDITDPELVWTSTAPDIAEVKQDGVAGEKAVVTAKKVGNSIIQIAQAATSYWTLRTFTLKVMPVATGITLTDNFSLYEGTSMLVSGFVSVAPAGGYDEFDYESSDEAIMTCEEGKIVGVAPGTATLTIRTKDGSNLYATATVRVKEKISLTKLELVPVGHDLMVNETAQIRCIMEPEGEDVTNEILSWESGNRNIVTVDASGKLKAVAAGTTQITATDPVSGRKSSIDVVVASQGVKSISFGEVKNASDLKELGVAFTESPILNYDSDEYLTVQMTKLNTKGYRADINLLGSGFQLDLETYPYFAIKIDLPVGNETNLTFNPIGKNGGGDNYSAGQNSKVLWYYDRSAHPQIFYFDMSGMGIAATDALKTFTIKVADVSKGNEYKLYWVHMFKSKDELDKFVASEQTN